MPALPLFCTYQVPLAIVNAVHTAAEPQTYTLVRNSSQATVEPFGTAAPIMPFQTDFIGWTTEQLRERARLLTSETSGTNLDNMGFVVLDEHSISNDTAEGSVELWYEVTVLDTLHPRSQQFHEIEAHDDQTGEISTIWKRLRLSFGDVDHVVSTLAYAEDCIKYYCLPQLVGEDGVYDVARALRIIRLQEPDPYRSIDDS